MDDGIGGNERTLRLLRPGAAGGRDRRGGDGACRSGELVVLPTNTVYGIGADTFDVAVTGCSWPRGAAGICRRLCWSAPCAPRPRWSRSLGAIGQDLIDQFWPGGLTLVCRASPTLAWDLGETRGTVAVRMPLHAVALDLLKKTGPMAVSSANGPGCPAATTADEAVEQLGDTVSVYLDGGPCSGGVASTIIDLTGSVPRLLRAGVIPMDRLREVAALVTGEDVPRHRLGERPGGCPVPPAGAMAPGAPGMSGGVADLPAPPARWRGRPRSAGRRGTAPASAWRRKPGRASSAAPAGVPA